MAPAKEDVKRFIPTLDEWKKHLLALDFYKDIFDDQFSTKEMKEVPDHFRDDKEYLEIFVPLYWEEVKQEIDRARQMEMTKDTERVLLQTFRLEHPFIRLDFSRNKSEATQRMYSQNDLVIVTQSEDPRDDTAVHFLALVDTSYNDNMSVVAMQGEDERMTKVSRLIASRCDWHLAKVISTQTMVREFEGLMSMPHIPLKDFIVNRDDESGYANTGTEMQAAPAVMGMKEAKKDLDDGKLFTVAPAIVQTLMSMYNEPQRSAIMDSRKVSGITLVQGPPGTGKTKTILGILTVLLNSRAREATAVSYRTGQKRKRLNSKGQEEADESSESEKETSDPQAARQKQAEDIQRRQERMRQMRGRMPWLRDGFTPWSAIAHREVLGPGDRELATPYHKLKQTDTVSMSEMAHDVAPKKVLVCTPSNAAVDEVLRRVGLEGIMNESGKFIKRNITRLGPNVHTSLNQFSLEHIVRQRLSTRTDMPDLNASEVEKEKIMRNAAILFSTLSITGSRDMVGFPGDFDTVVMDEASQGLETSTLVPLKLGCRRLIMVGDPQQLPATCFSSVAKKHKYERSLFQRLQQSNFKVNMLQIQYRMHPSISVFPSERFYEGKLLDALDAKAFETKFPAPWWPIPCFAPVVFFNLKGSQERAMSSLVNDDEANFVIGIYRVLSALYPDEPWRDRLAVISPYREQVQLIRRKFRALYSLPAKAPCPVEVNTVDGFQGREKDVIIVSVVRADPKSNSIGFVRDQRRMNVAFTRARQCLWVVGYAQVLSTNDDWRDFINLQRDHCRLLRTNQPFNTWLKRYLRSWFDRNPDLPRPAEDVIGTEAEMAAAEDEADKDGGGFTLAAEELEALEKKEREDGVYNQPDIEEVSDDNPEVEESLLGAPDDDDNIGGAGSDAEGHAAKGGLSIAEDLSRKATAGVGDGEDEGGGDNGE
mmetsp:Transcript_81250/g.263446  ORF Transcript_81250/g.263446 Transcript_81250/m.263446 type:complete len:934 (+) Transcript_81250:80-2881(+)